MGGGLLAVLPQVEDAPVLHALMRRAHFTVSLRLHGAVLSAAASTPFLALGYRLKTFDFVDSLQLPSSALRTDALLSSPGLFWDRLVSLRADQESIRVRLGAAVANCTAKYDAAVGRLVRALVLGD